MAITMDIKRALEIVLDLAEQNALKIADCNTPELKQQRREQHFAINLVDDFTKNIHASDCKCLFCKSTMLGT